MALQRLHLCFSATPAVSRSPQPAHTMRVTEAALAVAAGVQRYVRVQPCKKTVVFAGCHADVIAALAPDWLFDTGARILHDPLLNMAIREAPSTVASERCGDAVGLLHTNTPLDLSSSTTNKPEPKNETQNQQPQIKNQETRSRIKIQDHDQAP